MSSDPHGDGPIHRAGPTAASTERAAVLLHGRGADAAGMIDLMRAAGAQDRALFAPEAAGRSWWPTSFLAPMPALEPWLSSALSAVDRALGAAAAEGFDPAGTVLVGFSQGGCLALEHAARSGGPGGGVAGLAAGLVGTGDAGGDAEAALYGNAPKLFDYDAGLDGLPVLLTCHERDPHIPLARVRESAAILQNLGAAVETMIAPGQGHSLTDEGMTNLRRLLAPG